MMTTGTAEATAALQSALVHEGYALVRGEAMHELLIAAGSLEDWETFAASWDRLELDRYMADGGRYRRRSPFVPRKRSAGDRESQDRSDADVRLAARPR